MGQRKVKGDVLKQKLKSIQVGIVMGSDSDLGVMRESAEILEAFNVPFELTIVSAHRTPDWLYSYAKSAHRRGLRVLIAGAGGAAHLPGMVASLSPLPVIGVPILSRISLDGWDSLLSIVQMPPGVPVATVGLNGGRNAGILAAQILASSDAGLRSKIERYKKGLGQQVKTKISKLKRMGYRKYLTAQEGKTI